jgi:hypothetical protein
MLRIAGAEVCDLRLVGTKQESPLSLRQAPRGTSCYRTFASSSVACITARYSYPEFLKTSETIEFILDFSTGTMAAGKILRIAISSDSRIGLVSGKGFLSL